MNLSRFQNWQHIFIDEWLPGTAWGTGGTGVADFNGSGKPGVIISRRETQTAYWFEQINLTTWHRHEIGSSEYLQMALGAAVLDIDHDGWLDIAFGRVWFRNPGNLASHPNTIWEAIPYPGGGHDIVAADINGDGWLDLVTYNGHELAWFDTSDQMRKTILLDGRNDHGGIAPNGIGDLNGNGWVDIVLPGIWLENPGSTGSEWHQHAWPHVGVERASYGTSMRSWVVDLNGNGQNDIVYSDCDTGYAHVFWVENLGKGTSWELHRLPDPPGDEYTGSFHSLGVGDFDGDGRLEIFAGEQEDPDTQMVADGNLPMKPEGLQERGVIYVPGDSFPLTFTPVVIHSGRPGWHDAILFDVNQDGRLDIVSKVWNADGPNYHLDLWINQINSL